MPRTTVLFARLLAPLLLFLVCESIATAQGDMRLSPPRRRAIIRPDAMVQSAARIGARTLVVWGTSDWTADSSDHNVLRMQMLEDTSLLGEQRSAGSADARPFGYVQVIALDDRFLVLWNDRRAGDSAVYARVVGLDGEPTGEEYRFHDRPIAPAGAVAIHREGGFLLLWSDAGAADPINARLIDAAGLPAGEPFRYADGSIQRISRPSWLADIIMIDRGTLPPLLVDSNGDTAVLGRAALKFTLPYHLDADGSVATIAGDTVRLYTSLLDTIPARISVVPHAYGTIAGSEFIARDSSGSFHVFHAEGGVGGVSGPADALTASVTRSVEQAPGIWSRPVIITGISLAVPARSCEHASAEVVSVGHAREWGNLHRLTVRFEGIEVANCPEEYSARPLVKTMMVAINGRARIADSGDYSLPLPSEIPVRRVASAMQSEVAVTVDGAEVHLNARGRISVVAFPCMLPGIRSVDGQLVVSWLTAEEDTTANLGSWNPSIGQSPLESVHSSNILMPDSNSPRLLARKREMLRMDGQTLLSTSWFWRAHDTGSVIGRQFLSVQMPTDTGWRNIIRIDTVDTAYTLRRLSHAFDPIRHETIISWGMVGANGSAGIVHTWAFDKSGERSWGTDSLSVAPTSSFYTIPIGYNEFSYIGGSWCVRIKDNKRIAATAINSYVARFDRMIGPYVLRSEATETNLSTALFTLDGVQLIPNNSRIYGGMGLDACLVQRPRDSSLVFLTGSKSGIRMFVLNQSFHVLREGDIVSDSGKPAWNPSALYRNDSLFIVWQSDRDGTQDIYGRVIPGDQHSSVAGDHLVTNAAGDKAGFSVIPNPARDYVDVKLILPYETICPVEYNVLDLLGNVRLSFTSGRFDQSLNFSTQALPNGVYLLRASAMGHAYTARFVILH